MNTFSLTILEAEEIFFAGPCESLVIPTIDGQYGIQAMHHNLVAPIMPGILSYRTSEGETTTAAVSNGIIKVEDNEVLILVETAELPEEIDENRARRAEAAAKEALLQKQSIREYNDAQAKLARAISRLRVRDRYASKRGNKL